jgi:hypothetical protein
LILPRPHRFTDVSSANETKAILGNVNTNEVVEMNSKEMNSVDETAAESENDGINWEISPDGETSLEYLLYVLDID